MATIKVRVQGEIATNLTPEVKLVCQNDKYTVEFEFDESWDNSNFKTALFIYNGKSVPIAFDREKNGNTCKIPALYETELLHIGIKSNDVDGLHTSTPARVGCLLSANDISNGEIPNPTPSQYDEIIGLLNQYITGGGSGEGVDLRDYQKKVDDNLQTTDKTVVGAINEVNEKVGSIGTLEENDPTVPNWAKQPQKPTYTYEEIEEKPDLVEDIGSSIAEETNVLTIELKDKSGNVIASTEITLPKGGGETPDLSLYVKQSDRDAFVKGGLTENSETFTEEEKTKSCDLIGAVRKVYSVSGANRLYGVKSGTTETTLYNMQDTAIAYSIALRGTNGVLKVGKPTGNTDAVPKDYLVNLPDNITLTDEQKTKWRAMLGIE